jgi:hypothetical protein
MTDMGQIKDSASGLAEHVCGSGLADARTTARKAVRPLSDDAVRHRDIPMIHHLEKVPIVSDPPRHFAERTE